MLVEVLFNAEDASTLGASVACGDYALQELHIDCTAQVRVAYALVPHQLRKAIACSHGWVGGWRTLPTPGTNALFLC